MRYPFTQDQMESAAKEWGCNCGPSALAFAMQSPLHVAREAIPDFDRKRYTSPQMMHAALGSLGIRYQPHPVKSTAAMFDGGGVSLVRVQWTGPWTGKWAYWHTHWISSWREDRHNACLVFDCNGGVRDFLSWEREIVPLLLPKRGDGKWHPTHIWQITEGGEGE